MELIWSVSRDIRAYLECICGVSLKWVRKTGTQVKILNLF